MPEPGLFCWMAVSAGRARCYNGANVVCSGQSLSVCLRISFSFETPMPNISNRVGVSSQLLDLGSEILSSFVQRRTALIGHQNVDVSLQLDQVRLAVVLVAWEPDGSMQTASMLERSLPSLQKQLVQSGIHADLFLVLNNGGGPSRPIQDQLLARVESVISRIQPVLGAQIVEVIPPDPTESAAVPWAIDASLQRAEFFPGFNQILILRQPSHPYNKGKIRGLRDVCQFLGDRVLSGRYGVDLIYQIDAETMLSMDGNEGVESEPVSALVAPFVDPYCQAVCSKERYLVFDDNSGERLDGAAVPASHILMDRTTNRGHLSYLAGGSLMSRVPSYLAAISALTCFTPSLGAEDYGYTSILRQASRSYGLWPSERAVKLIPCVRHVNRIPSSRTAAMRQFANWVLSARAVDQLLFPDVANPRKSFWVYAVIVLRQRFRELGRYGLWNVFKSLWLDMLDLPSLWKLSSGKLALPTITNAVSPMMWTGDAVSVEAIRG